MKDKLISLLNQLLMVDVFLVLFSFVWLALALLGKSIGIPLGFDLWYSLWEPVFTPAIGLLMAGAIAIGIINKLRQKFTSPNK
ncbi:MAG: hypothetical protein F6K36_14735 [Symploca sp. SIO3C6]|nr:hypothetical protein [Symploca sp. SIO3C6]NET03683.1 hypothetical protein [Symploca sp. SIO2B6]